ncbi:hypothetical protein QIW52_02435 [Clostridioides difficile]|nr:hypothetical protein [Clostridioides difficile]
MIKIELTNEIKQYHKKYFKTKIRPNFKGHKIEFDNDYLKFEHEEFMKFCSQNYEDLAIGNFDKLRKINKDIKKKYPIILEMIDKKKCTYKNKKDVLYKDVLLDIFGYNKFIDISIFEYIKKQAILDTNENKYSYMVFNKMIDILNDIYSEKVAIIESYKNEYRKSLKHMSVKNFEKKFNEDLFNIDITIDNFKKHYNFEDIWSPYMFIFITGLRVCPYCNRQYITPVYSSSGKLRADLDHFLPKNKYPFFSMSLYNLIPSCKFCNSSLKGTKEFDFDSLNPYECNIDDYIKFEIDLASNTNNIIVNPIKDKDKAKDYLNMFKIETLYNYHRNQASDLLKKKLIYSDEYLENMYKYFGNSFSSFDEMKELVIGYTISKENINDEPLAKFKRDISKQLGFIEEVDKDTIDKLKLLHTSITE